MLSFVQSYIENIKQVLSRINPQEIVDIIGALEKCHERGGRIFVMGNGGSAATASHMANDLAVGLKLRGIRQFDVESLGDNVAVCTAIANDTGYENIFSLQLEGRLKKKDLLIGISCSGNSPNIVKAVDYANSLGVTVVGLTGFDGGQLKQKADHTFHVATEKGDYGVVEDLHMMVDHVIFSYYQQLKSSSELADAG
ncbi:SIS domain-containing protein [Brumicola nitratireducens]|uniref:Sugar isomerase n=1 Tax=Glaciecola nitratireducens (strain JCM 12485 / KCTC 12276 / FR1064) TaxID=1085623 RepID=G4QLY6_GLANF|nr:SIS domain-containing protein [Glaciecola nitratireducens]AEP30476.1 sugar isomerase [Glaciecola nitratireducens FR1064]